MFAWSIFVGCNFGKERQLSGRLGYNACRSWITYICEIVESFCHCCSRPTKWSFGQRQTIKIAWRMKQMRPIWNASVYKDEVQVEMWLKSQMERKILKFIKYEKHVTSEGKPAISHRLLPPRLCSHRAPASVSFPSCQQLWVGSNVHCWASWALPTSLDPVHVSLSSSAFMEVSLELLLTLYRSEGYYAFMFFNPHCNIHLLMFYGTKGA